MGGRSAEEAAPERTRPTSGRGDKTLVGRRGAYGGHVDPYPQAPTTRSKQPCSAKGPGLKLPGSASVAPMAATVPGRKPSLASNPPGRGCGGRLRARRLAHIPFCGEWRGAYLIRIMPPVPLPRGWAWERAAQDARLLAAVSTATPCVASRKLPARGDAPSLCMRAADRACFSRPIFYHFRPLEAHGRRAGRGASGHLWDRRGGQVSARSAARSDARGAGEVRRGGRRANPAAEGPAAFAGAAITGGLARATAT